jgi:hypothetical protein
MGCYNFYLRNEWNSLERTDIINITDEGLFRLEGLMNESSDLVIFPPEKRTFSIEDNIREKTEFRFSDNTGTVLARTDRYMDIEYGPHIIRDGEDSSEKVYRGEDEVIIIGKVVEGQKNLTIQIIWMGTDDADIPLTFPLAVLSIGSVLLYLVICSFSWIIYVLRALRHNGSLECRNEVLITDMDKPKTDGLDWHDLRSFWVRQGNKPFFTKKRGVQLLKILWFLVLLVLGIIYWYVDPYRVSDYAALSVYVTIIFPILILTTGIYLGRKSLSPSAYALSQKGFHMYYEEPVERFLAYDSLPWNKIKGFYKFRTGRTVEWKIVTTHGVKVDINFMTQEKRNLAVRKWKKMTKKKLTKK